jgi:hypothetical protein
MLRNYRKIYAKRLKKGHIEKFVTVNITFSYNIYANLLDKLRISYIPSFSLCFYILFQHFLISIRKPALNNP